MCDWNHEYRTHLLVGLAALLLGLIDYSSLGGSALGLPAFGNSTLLAQNQTPNFNRDVRPILAAKCFACHGPDEESREAELRLDQQESAFDSGAIVAGEPNQSELVHRILATDDEQMPPAESGEALTEKQVAILKAWIKAGGQYEKHWAFVPPKQSVPPAKKSFPKPLQDWPRNTIDHFVLKKIVDGELQPSPSADPYELVRRVYLDLIGLPPTPEQADAFAKDKDPAAYEKLVDKLLRSESFGEKWAREWLDLARYADTNGYEKDRRRSIWPYRDWVIKAINADMPFDQFSIEQLAGDMLPNASNSQRVATGFHRNTMLNEEGGIDPLEYRFYAMVDRVATTGTVWMGLTTGCAQCHTHKYDPITHTDYYQLMALLNNADEPDLAVFDPAIDTRRQQLLDQIERLEKDLADKYIQKNAAAAKSSKNSQLVLDESIRKWVLSKQDAVTNWKRLAPSSTQTNLPKLSLQNDKSLFASGDFTKRDVYELEFNLQPNQKVGSIRLEVLPDDRLPAGGPGNAYYEGRKGDFFLSELEASIDGKKIPFKSASTTFGKISIGSGSADGKNVFDNEGSTGWSTAGQEGKRNVLALNLNETVTGSSLKIKMIFERHFVASLGRFRISVSENANAKASGLPDEIERQMANFDKDKSVDETLRKHFLLTTPELKSDVAAIEKLRKQIPRFSQTMVLRERDQDNPRPTYRHHRGEYLSPKEKVNAQLPSLFQAFENGTDPNRLNFAKWLVSPQNPLAARVTTNRIWQSLFGRGIVETSGDFGTQGATPSHPELLDWLAVNFQQNGWSRKKLIRLIVTSSTYRQTSNASTQSYVNDPANEWLARGPRFRVNAEVVRDIMLTASGKLSGKMYGPSVYPPQPKSVTAIAYGNTAWPVSKGEDRYRRSLYTFSKRTAPFAAYLTFNSPTGENCVAKRNRSNSPLQALTILNDEMFVELARALAEKAVEEQAEDQKSANKKNADLSVAARIFRRLLTRPPTDDELNRILKFKNSQLGRIQKGELKPVDIIGSRSTQKQALQELAAWTLVARALMSLDEVITKP